MYFDPTYFDGETREGFYITPLMKRAWAASIEVLKAVESVCKKHDLTYFASHGTMLGAVRHKGYVPWDDDLDIAMSRKDMNIFLKYARQELPEGYRVYTAEDDFKEFLIRVTNTDRLKDSFDHMNRFHGFPFVSGMDIFVYDDLPEDSEEEDLFLSIMRLIYDLVYEWYEDTYTEEEKENKLKEVEELCNYTINREEPIRPQLLQLGQYLSSCFQDDKAKEVSIMFMLSIRKNYRFPKHYIQEVMEVPFENTTIMIPTHYHEMLSNLYGKDYMTPRQIRGGHDYPFYKNQLEVFFKTIEEQDSKLVIPDYFYEKRE